LPDPARGRAVSCALAGSTAAVTATPAVANACSTSRRDWPVASGLSMMIALVEIDVIVRT
jgi:ABC-type spermidine/putrescine transport system permease subunit I